MGEEESMSYFCRAAKDGLCDECLRQPRLLFLRHGRGRDRWLSCGRGGGFWDFGILGFWDFEILRF